MVGAALHQPFGQSRYLLGRADQPQRAVLGEAEEGAGAEAGLRLVGEFLGLGYEGAHLAGGAGVFLS